MNHWTKQKEPNSFKEHYSGDLKFKKEIKKRKVLHCIIWDFTLSGLDLEQVHAHGNWIALSSLQTTITQGPKSCPIEPTHANLLHRTRLWTHGSGGWFWGGEKNWFCIQNLTYTICPWASMTKGCGSMHIVMHNRWQCLMEALKKQKKKVWTNVQTVGR